jgi:Hemerythrin HHE cation binding domain
MTTVAREPQAIWTFAEHEHLDLARGIDHIHDIACEIGRRPTPELSVHVLGILQWSEQVLSPHMAWEDGWLFPEIDARAGTTWATRFARFDHRQIREMLGQIRIDQRSLAQDRSIDRHAGLRCHLFGLEALLRAHIEREQRFLIPVLDEDRTAVEPEASAATGRGR